jgi:hypothetical protein
MVVNFIVLSGELGRTHAHLDDKSRAVKNAYTKGWVERGNETIQSLILIRPSTQQFIFQKLVVQLNQEFLRVVFAVSLQNTQNAIN